MNEISVLKISHFNVYFYSIHDYRGLSGDNGENYDVLVLKWGAWMTRALLVESSNCKYKQKLLEPA